MGLFSKGNSLNKPQKLVLYASPDLLANLVMATYNFDLEHPVRPGDVNTLINGILSAWLEEYYEVTEKRKGGKLDRYDKVFAMWKNRRV